MSKISSKEFNKKRRDLLIQKDENKRLTNIDLGMYDYGVWNKKIFW